MLPAPDLLAPPVTDAARFALALEQMDGVGRVTAGRLLAHFASYEALRAYPREQVLARIQGAPRAEALVGRLFDAAHMQPRFAEADRQLADLERRGVAVLTAHHPAWPSGLDALPRNRRPVVLYAYGHLDALARPVVAFLARPPLAPEPFEQAQALVRHLLPHGIAPATGAAHGFDVVVHKLAGGADPPAPSLLVASCGMAKAPPRMRPTISAAVHHGGLFLSSFPMNHGPFEHDDAERAAVTAALARACVFVEPRAGTPEGHALAWALENGRPVFGLASGEQPLPPAVHPLREPVDFDWVLAAARGTP